MTPTATLSPDGERVIVSLGDATATMAPDEADTFARAVAAAADKADRATRLRTWTEARDARRATFRLTHPDAVDVNAWGGPGIASVWYDAEGRAWAAACLDRYRDDRTQDLDTIGVWPVAVPMSAGMGVVSHLWRGGGDALCKRHLANPRRPGGGARACARCAAIEAARGAK